MEYICCLIDCLHSILVSCKKRRPVSWNLLELVYLVNFFSALLIFIFYFVFFMCSRETGGLNRIIDRGSRAINFILSSMVFNVVPTILEVCRFLLLSFFLRIVINILLSWILIVTSAALTMKPFRFLWYQVYLHTNLEHHLHWSLPCQWLHMLLSHWLWHR